MIAIMAMLLLPRSAALAEYFATPIWGNASRGTIALYVLAMPVQFGSGGHFYVRAWKSIRGVWTRDGPGRWRDRLLRWGSMDSLGALGTTTGWSASGARKGSERCCRRAFSVGVASVTMWGKHRGCPTDHLLATLLPSVQLCQQFSASVTRPSTTCLCSQSSDRLPNAPASFGDDG